MAEPSGKRKFLENIDSWFAKLPPDLKQNLKSITSLSNHSTNGFDRLKSENPSRDVWFHYSGFQDERPYIRQTSEKQSIAWTTAATSGSNKQALFVFAGGLGWISQPETDGFQVSINGNPQLIMDVTGTSARWQSDNGDVELNYLVTWNSNIDSAGLFYLSVPTEMLDEENKLTVEVRSLGKDSLRWFSLDELQEVKTVEKAIAEQFESK